MNINHRIMIGVLILILLLIGNNYALNQEKISLVYLYGNYDFDSLIQRNVEGVNVVSPSYFDLTHNGNLSMNAVDQELIQKLHENHIKVIPFLSNHWDRQKGRKALQSPEHLIEDLVQAMNEYQLDGINIDIENLTNQDRDAYVTFVQKMKEKLPPQKILSVAVAANPNGINTGWQGSYDYQELAKYADYLVIMAYDEHYEGGEKGAVASKSFVRKSLDYATSQVDKSKIVVGLPFYGRVWKKGEETGGYGITLKQIQYFLQKYQSSTYYDESLACMVASVVIKVDDEKPSINGKILTEGTYHIYYENEESINSKIETIKEYGVKGIAAWSLGQETNEVWNTYTNYLLSIKNQNHGKEEETKVEDASWAKDAIAFVIQKGWMIGKAKESFAPNDYLTRAECAVILSRILQVSVENNDRENEYLDIENHWACRAVNTISRMGFMEGYKDGYFYPEKQISREEVAKVFCSFVREQETQNTAVIYDISKERWSYPYIQKMVKNGILKGYDDGTVRPQNGITRAEMATILKRLFDEMEK